MEHTIHIAKGLRQSYKNAVTLSLPETLIALKKRTDCYEVLNDGYNRPYGDIDGKLAECTEEQFEAIDKATREALVAWLSDEPHSLMTASSFLHRKISYRFVMTQYAVTKEDNKEWIKRISQEVVLPESVHFDFGVYGKNQKMRMVGSNKDGENRPLRLLHGTDTDTLISYVPEDAERLQLPKKEQKTKNVKKECTLLSKLLESIGEHRFDEYETWVKIGMICFNEGADVSVWDEYSQRSLKYKAGDCLAKWKTFTKSSLSIATLWKWLQEDDMEAYERLKQDDYEYRKVDFEQTHFKLMNPAVYVRIYNDKITLLKHNDLLHMYSNLFCNNELFVSKWIKDPTIRTYEELVYKPKQTVAENMYNLFTDFPIVPVQGDISAVHDVLRLISNHDQAVFDYIEKWVAWILQMPYNKTGTSIVIQGDQGIGKDTYFDFVGTLFGDYFFNTNRAEEDVFTRFNGHLKKSLLLKFEEASFLVNKKNESALKSLITCSRQAYENKGVDPVTLDNYFNIVMTTNNEIPIHVEQTDRRFVLVRGSSERRGDLAFWNRIHDTLKQPEVAQAYMHHLLHLDLTGFNPRDRPITEYYEEVKQAFIPYHAQLFQDEIEHNQDCEHMELNAKQFYETAKQKNSKFDLSKQKFGRDILKYVEDGVVERVYKRDVTCYRLEPSKMKEYLTAKKWWVSF